MARNIEMNYKTSSGSYEVLYPQNTTSNITDFTSYMSNYYTKTQVDSQISTAVNNAKTDLEDNVIEPVGTIKCTSRTDLGNDWLLCDGSDFDASTYPELASLLPGSAQSQWFNVGVDGCSVSGEIYECNGYKMRFSKSGSTLYLYYTNNFKVNGSWSRATLGTTYGGTIRYVYHGSNNRYYIGCINESGQLDLYYSSVNSMSSWTRRQFTNTLSTAKNIVMCDDSSYLYVQCLRYDGIYYSWYYVLFRLNSNGWYSSGWTQIQMYDNSDQWSATTNSSGEEFTGIDVDGARSSVIAFTESNNRDFTILSANTGAEVIENYSMSSVPKFFKIEDGTYFIISYRKIDRLVAGTNGAINSDKSFDANLTNLDNAKKNQIVGDSSTCWYLLGSSIFINSGLSSSGQTRIAIGTPKLDGLVKQGSSVYGFIGNNLYTYNSGTLPDITGDSKYRYYIKAK